MAADWKKIKTEYVTGRCSYKDLSQKYGVGTTAIYERSRKERWVEARKKHRERAVNKAIRKAEDREAERLSKIGDLAGMAVDVAVKAFKDEDQFYRYLVSESPAPGMTATVERRFDKVDTKALRDLTVCIKELTGILRDVYRIPTQAEEESQRIAAERLNLERQKVAAGQQDNGAEVEVVFTGTAGEEGWAD